MPEASSAAVRDRSLWRALWYDFMRLYCRVLAVMFLQVRVYGREHVPPTGGAMLLSNHQSFFDPVLIGLACERRLNFLARKTLFRFAPFRWLISSLEAIPIDRDGTSISGLKETLRRLKQDKAIVLFPEGTRTPDGEVKPLKSGFCTLARRTHVRLVPLAIEGAYQAWPRNQRWPHASQVQIVFGPPLEPDEVAELSDAELIERVQNEIAACHAQVRRPRLDARRGTQGGV